MHITLSPVAGAPILTITRDADILVLDGVGVDFSALEEGDILPSKAIAHDAFQGDVTRIGGKLHATIKQGYRLPSVDDAGTPGGAFPERLHALAQGKAESMATVDWTQVVSAEAALEALRKSTFMPKRPFLKGMVAINVLAPEEAVDAVRGKWPATFASFLTALPAEAQFEAQMEWAGADTINRVHPLLLQIQAETKKETSPMPEVTDEALDTLFGITP